MDREQSLIIPSLFDGTNYAYWKVRMRIFLQSLDKKVWQAVEIGQTKPTEVPVNWDDAKIKAAYFNSRALNAFTVTVNPTDGIVEEVDKEDELLESKFEKMDD